MTQTGNCVGEAPKFLYSRDMAAVNDGDLAFVSDYRKLLLLLSDQLSTEQLKKLIFLCGDYIVERKAEELQNALDLFKTLEQQYVIGSGKVEFLIEILNQIGRQDLALKVNNYASQMTTTRDPTAAQSYSRNEEDAVMRENNQGSNLETDGIAHEETRNARRSDLTTMADVKTDHNSHTTDDLVTDGNDNEDTGKGNFHRVALKSDNCVTTRGPSGAECAFFVQPPSNWSQTLPIPGNPQSDSSYAPSKPKAEHKKKRMAQSVKQDRKAQTRYTNFLMCDGYVVEIVGGKHFTTPDGEFVEMKSGTQYKIFVKNMHPRGCNLDISIDGYDIGGWVLDGHQEFKIERPAYDNRTFTFYRVKQAPEGSGIEKGKEENGLVECVFTPESDIPVLVSTPELFEPIQIQMPPHATVKDVKHEAQRRLGSEEDADQVMTQGTRMLDNRIQLRSCGMQSSQVLLLLKSELEITIQASTGQIFPVTVHPGRAKVKDVMEKIKRHTDVPVKDQQLYHGETCLSDRPWKPLPEALILMEDPVLAVDIPEYLEISVRLTEGEVIPIKIDKLKTLVDLQSKVPACAIVGIKMRVWFIHEGKKLNPLKDSGSLVSYGLESGSVLDVQFEVVLISVTVRLPDGIEAKLVVDPNGTLKDLLQKVSFHGGEELGEMEYILNGSTLQLQDTTARLKECGVIDGSILEIRKKGNNSDESLLGPSPEDYEVMAPDDYEVIAPDDHEAPMMTSAGSKKGITERRKPPECSSLMYGVQRRTHDGNTTRRPSSNDERYKVMPQMAQPEMSAAAESKSVTDPDPNWRAGGTTLQGHSNQHFVPAQPIRVEKSRKVVLTLRLVARDDEEVGPFPPEECKPLSTLYPPSVPE